MKSKTKKTSAKKAPAKKKPVRAGSPSVAKKKPAAKKKAAPNVKKKTGTVRTTTVKAATTKKKAAPAAKKKAAPAKPGRAKKVTSKKKPATKKVTPKKAAAPSAKKKVVSKKKTATVKPPATKKKSAKKAAPQIAPSLAPVKKKAKAKSRRAKPKFPPMTDGSVSVVAFTPYQERKGEEYMNEDQVEHFRNILFGWKHQLMEEVDRTLLHMQDEAANFPDPNDRATQESEFTLELRTRDRERKLIRKIDEAVMTLDIGDYGFCETCGVEIGIRRLEARPTATLCIDCKVLDEIRERQMG